MISPCYFLAVDLGSPLAKIAKLSKKNHVFARNGSLLHRHAILKKMPVIQGKSVSDFVKKIARQKKNQHIVLYGKGLDSRIEKPVADLVKAGFSVWIPVDAVEFRKEKERENILIELRKLGAQMGNTVFILHST